MSRRNGASMVSVLVFFMMAAVITAQVYFFTTLSLEDGIEEREIMTKRVRLAALVEREKKNISTSIDTNYRPSYDNSGKNFHDLTVVKNTDFVIDEDGYHARVYRLNYGFANPNNIQDNINETLDTDSKSMDRRIFASMPPDNGYTYKNITALNGTTPVTDETTLNTLWGKLIAENGDIATLRKYYLIRAYTETDSGRHIMHQVLVRSEDKVEYKNNIEVDDDELTGAYTDINPEGLLMRRMLAQHEDILLMPGDDIDNLVGSDSGADNGLSEDDIAKILSDIIDKIKQVAEAYPGNGNRQKRQEEIKPLKKALEDMGIDVGQNLRTTEFINGNSTYVNQIKTQITTTIQNATEEVLETYLEELVDVVPAVADIPAVKDIVEPNTNDDNSTTYTVTFSNIDSADIEVLSYMEVWY